MLDGLRRFFGLNSVSKSEKETLDLVMKHVEDMETRFGGIGVSIADDCVENGLRSGELVKLSDIESMISRKSPDRFDPICTGFLGRMNQYVEKGEIISLQVEGGDLVFIHKDYAEQFLARFR